MNYRLNAVFAEYLFESRLVTHIVLIELNVFAGDFFNSFKRLFVAVVEIINNYNIISAV